MDPMIVDNTISPPKKLSAQVLLDASNRAIERWEQGDRAGAYLELYKVTGNEELLLHAQITTYSGAPGGMAIEGNFQARMQRPDLYKITLDRFSHKIDYAVIDSARQLAEAGHPEKFTDEHIRKVAREAWKREEMGELFPGNAREVGRNSKIADTAGGRIGVGTQDEAELGRRPSQYKNNPKYEIRTGERFITVFNKENNRIEVFFDKEFDSTRGTAVDGWAFDVDLQQVKDEIPNATALAEQWLKMRYLQAGEMKPAAELAPFNPTNPKLPANVDRVFEFGGKLYQFDDQKLLESKFNFSEVLRGSSWHGLDYSTALKKGGNESAIVTDTTRSPQERKEKFDKLIAAGLIKPLSEEEAKNYTQALDQLQKAGLPAPYESQKEAFKKLYDALDAGAISAPERA